MAHNYHGVLGSMKGRKSVPEHEEDALTQAAGRAVVDMVLETSHQETQGQPQGMEFVSATSLTTS